MGLIKYLDEKKMILSISIFKDTNNFDISFKQDKLFKLE